MDANNSMTEMGSGGGGGGGLSCSAAPAFNESVLVLILAKHVISCSNVGGQMPHPNVNAMTTRGGGAYI